MILFNSFLVGKRRLELLREYLNGGNQSSKFPQEQTLEDLRPLQPNTVHGSGGLLKQWTMMNSRPGMDIGPTPSPSQQNLEPNVEVEQGWAQS